MKSKNRVELMGNTGSSPRTGNTGSGKLYVYLSLATSHRWKDATGNYQQLTEWHKLIAYGRNAEILRDYTQKGSSLAIEGRLRTRSYLDKKNEKRDITEIVVEDVNLLDKKPPTQVIRDEPDQADESIPAPDDISDHESVPF